MESMDPTGDLRVPPGPGAPGGLVVPAAELTERFSRASGPGGQGVNTTDSRVQLSLDLTLTTALSPAQRDRALKALATRLADGSSPSTRPSTAPSAATAPPLESASPPSCAMR